LCNLHKAEGVNHNRVATDPEAGVHILWNTATDWLDFVLVAHTAEVGIAP